MLVLLRIIFGAALFYGLVTTRRYAGEHPESGDVMGAFNLAVCVILAVINALLWAPYFGAKIAEPLTGVITQSTYVERKNYLLRLLRWVQDRGWRRLTLLLAFLEGVHHPEQPAAFVMGLKNARRGSWLEKVFAREVFRFDNAQNCVLAFETLRRHGIDPRPHRNPEVNMLLISVERSVQPDPVKVSVRPAPPPPEPKRDPRIRLFDPKEGPRAS
ncbi:MAG: hypothetical protein FJ398_16540 [Verrucomicrobia bacterium]|nr:hypothetical protein [Verrucomicrobiota bacterium]